MATYELVEYDVWGNEEDGFDVNNVYKTGILYEISENETEEEIIHRMSTEEKRFPSGFIGQTVPSTWLKPEAATKIEIDFLGSPEFIEFVAKETGEPIGRLELKED